MGTNYYRRNIPTQDVIEKVTALFEKDQYDKAISVIKSLSTEEVHLCKISYGWQVCFDHNLGKYYRPNKKSLIEFLTQPGTEIVNEYGEIFTPEQFWIMVKTHNSQHKKTYTSESEQENIPVCIYQDVTTFCINKFNVSPSCNEFVVDGLRFAVFPDFR